MNLVKRIYVIAVLIFLPIAIFANNGEKFKLVKSVSELNDGDLIIIGKKANNTVKYNYTLGKEMSSTGKIGAVKIDISDDIATIGDDVEVLQILKKDNLYNLKSKGTGKYLCNSNTNKSSEAVKYLENCKDNNGKTGYVSISIDKATYNAAIKYAKNGKYLERVFCFKESSGGSSVYYSCYNPQNISSYQNDPAYCVQIYKYMPSDLEIKESTDNAKILSDNLNKKVSVSLGRTLVADKWNTFCLPFDVKLTDGKLAGTEVKLMKFGSVEGNVMFFTQADEIKAGEPYLIKPSMEIVNPKFSNVEITETKPKQNSENGYSFNGVFSPKTFSENESQVALFVTGDAKFKHPKTNTTMKGMRAYFMCPSAETASAQLQMDGTITEISEIVSDKDTDGYIYNMNGVCIGKEARSLGRGLYIKNGKKIIVK